MLIYAQKLRIYSILIRGCDNIFNNLADFSYRRNTKEAIEFYIAYLFLTIVFGIFLGFAFSSIVQNNTYSFGLTIGTIFAVVVSLGISFLILKEKNLLGNSGSIFSSLTFWDASHIFRWITEELIPVAYLTTKPVNTK